MARLPDHLKKLEHQLLAHTSELHRLINAVADDLRQPPPRKPSPHKSPPHKSSPRKSPTTLARLLQIDALVVQFNPLLLAFSRAHTTPPEVLTSAKANLHWRKLSNDFNFARAAIHRWHLVRKLVEQQLREPRYSLMRRRPATLGRRDVEDRLADDLFNALHLALTQQQQDKTASASGAFADIGLHNSAFAELLHAAYRLRLVMGGEPTRFLDVGCGAGSKVMGAARFFPHIAGIELDPGYLARARELLGRAGLTHAELTEIDAQTFGKYSDYDVIYFFRPLRDHGKLLLLEQKITLDANARTLLIAPYSGFEQRHKEYDCKQIAQSLFITGTTRTEARRLKQCAEYSGLAVQPPRDPLPGIWQPILDVSHANGFDLHRPGRLDGV